MTVELVKHSAADSDVLLAARVSTAGEQSLEELTKDPERSKGLINYLMRDRHGSPFEHNSMTFFISAPIFVFREFMRHRVGWSYNEESGRYRELQPVFYVPAPTASWSSRAAPASTSSSRAPRSSTSSSAAPWRTSYRQAYEAYQEMLAAGVAREVARAVLPVGLFSSMYATCNARSLMHFLGLRTQHELAKVPSFPQREIEMVGEKMEAQWARAHAADPRGLQRQRPRRPVARPSGRAQMYGQPAKCPYCGISRSSSRLIKRTRHCLNPRAGSAGLRSVAVVPSPEGAPRR